MVNIILDVKFEDDYRYQLIYDEKNKGNQTESQTKDISIYYIRKKNQPEKIYQIIDTPGYFDTEKNIDERYKEMFHILFEKIIPEINCICVIAKASDNRFTENDKILSQELTGLFSKGIENNVFAVCTHYDDGGKENVKNYLLKMDFFKNKKTQKDSWIKVINNIPIFQKKLEIDDAEEEETEEAEEKLQEIKKKFEKQKKIIIKLLKQIDELKVVSTTKFNELLEKHSKINENIQGLKEFLVNFFGRFKDKKKTEEEIINCRNEHLKIKEKSVENEKEINLKINQNKEKINEIQKFENLTKKEINNLKESIIQRKNEINQMQNKIDQNNFKLHQKNAITRVKYELKKSLVKNLVCHNCRHTCYRDCWGIGKYFGTGGILFISWCNKCDCKYRNHELDCISYEEVKYTENEDMYDSYAKSQFERENRNNNSRITKNKEENTQLENNIEEKNKNMNIRINELKMIEKELKKEEKELQNIKNKNQ